MNTDHLASAGQVPRPRFPASADWIGLATVLVAAVAGYLLFPDNLALLTRIIGVIVLVPTGRSTSLELMPPASLPRISA